MMDGMAPAEKLKIIGEKELKDSYGNIIKTQKAILPAFKIGHTTRSLVPVGFFAGAIGRQKMSIIGGDILSFLVFFLISCSHKKNENVYDPNNYIRITFVKVEEYKNGQLVSKTEYTVEGEVLYTDKSEVK